MNIMKNIILIIIALTLSTGANSALITTGDTITVNFDLSGDPGVEPNAKQIWFNIIFTPFANGPDLAVNPGEYIAGQWFENPGDLVSLQTDDYLKVKNLDYDVYSWGNSFNVFNGLGLNDNAGLLVFDDIVGDFEITRIDMWIWNTGATEYTNFVSQDFTVTASASVVPAPAAVWLFGSGLLGLIGIARRKTRA